MRRLHEGLNLGSHLIQSFVKVAGEGDLKPGVNCCCNDRRAVPGRTPGGGLGEVLPEIRKDAVTGVSIGEPVENIADNTLPPSPLAVATGGVGWTGLGVNRLLPFPCLTKTLGEFYLIKLDPLPAGRLLIGHSDRWTRRHERVDNIENRRFHAGRKSKPLGAILEFRKINRVLTSVFTCHTGCFQKAMRHGVLSREVIVGE